VVGLRSKPSGLARFVATMIIAERASRGPLPRTDWCRRVADRLPVSAYLLLFGRWTLVASVTLVVR
jgi:hypothetical protein